MIAKKIFSVCSLLLLFYNLKAQQIFQKSYYVDSVFQTTGQSFVKLNNGDYLCAGRIGSSQTYDAFLMRTDSFGSIKWSKKLATPYKDWVTFITATDDSNFIIDGVHSDFPTGMNKPYNSLFKIKIDEYGNVIWNKTYIDSAFYFEYWFKKTIPLNNSYYSAGGTIVNLNYGSSTLYPDSTELGFFAKIDAGGNVIWAKKYGSYKTVINDFVLTADNGFILVGSHETFDTINGLRTSMIYFKTDSNGNVIWSFDWDPYYAEAKTIIEDNKTYLIGGNKSGGGGGDGFIIKIDSLGNILWQKNYSGGGYNDVLTITKLNNNKYVFTEGVSIFIVIDSDGNNAVWHGVSNISGYYIEQLIHEKDGGLSTFGLKLFKAALYKTDSNLYTCTNNIGTFTTTNLNVINDTFPMPVSLIQISLVSDSFGTQPINILDSTFCFTITNSFENNTNRYEFEIYPNPCDDFLTIKINQIEKGSCSFSITDLTGRIVINSIELKENNIVDIRCFNSGVYLIVISSPKQTWTKKIIKL